MLIKDSVNEPGPGIVYLSHISIAMCNVIYHVYIDLTTDVLLEDFPGSWPAAVCEFHPNELH